MHRGADYKNMRGKITLQILEALSGAALGAIDLFEVFISTPYGASLGDFERGLSRQRRKRSNNDSGGADRARYYSFIYKLKRDGLIKEQKMRGVKMFLSM